VINKMIFRCLVALFIGLGYLALPGYLLAEEGEGEGDAPPKREKREKIEGEEGGERKERKKPRKERPPLKELKIEGTISKVEKTYKKKGEDGKERKIISFLLTDADGNKIRLPKIRASKKKKKKKVRPEKDGNDNPGGDEKKPAKKGENGDPGAEAEKDSAEKTLKYEDFVGQKVVVVAKGSITIKKRKDKEFKIIRLVKIISIRKIGEGEKAEGEKAEGEKAEGEKTEEGEKKEEEK